MNASGSSMTFFMTPYYSMLLDDVKNTDKESFPC